MRAPAAKVLPMRKARERFLQPRLPESRRAVSQCMLPHDLPREGLSMAGIKLIRMLAVLALLGAGLRLSGQAVPQSRAGSGALAGKLTNLHSRPLADVEVVVRNHATGAEVHLVTAKNGSYRTAGLAPGIYDLVAESASVGRGALTGILVQAGQETHVQTAMTFEPLPPPRRAVAAHEIPAEEEVMAAEIPAAPVRNLRPNLQTMPGFVHDPPPVEAQELRVELATPLRQARGLQGLPAQTPEQPEPQIVPPVLAVHAVAPAVSVEVPLVLLTLPPVAETSVEKPVAAAAAVLTSTLTGAEVQALPAGGRRWEEFTLDAPATASSAGAGRSGSHGPGAAEAETEVDGVSTRLAFGSPGAKGRGSTGQTEGEPAGMGTAWAGGRGFAVSEAALRTVETTASNVEAEAGRAAGGRVRLSTQRGSNGLHGQGFFYDRENVWGARNPFTQWVQETAAATPTTTPVFTAKPYTPPDHETVWGIGMGSQIRRDRLFWFAALDSSHRNDPGVSSVKHPEMFFALPTNDQLQLLGAQLGSGSLAVPRYTQVLETLDGLLGPAARTAAQWVGFGRLDWDLGERNRLTAEATAAIWNAPGGGFTRVAEAYGNHSFGSSQARELRAMGRWETFLTPNLLAVTQASMGRSVLNAHAETPSSYEQTLNVNVWGQLPQIVVDSRYGFTIGNPARFGEGSYPDERFLHAQQSVDWVRDKVMVRAGFQLDHNADRTGLVRNHTGTYHYASVENFATDALVFAAYGMTDALDKMHQHNCDQTGKVWRDSSGGLRGLGYLPCYSYYTQTMGPTDWHVSTNEWAGYATAQWQPAKFVMLSAGLRWEREQLPPPIAAVDNPALPLTEKTPSFGNNWGPRVSLAVGGAEKRWPVFRLGYGIYFSQMQNSTLQMVLSHTGSLAGDLSFFLRPTDNLSGGGAPPFPYVFAGEPLNLVKPAAVEFAPGFHNPEVHQALASVEEKLPGHLQITAGALVSLARRLPVTVDTNIDPAMNPGSITYAVVDASGKGPIKAAQVTTPLYANWPSATGLGGRLNTGYQQIVALQSRANSTYEAAVVRVNRHGAHGLTLHAHYTYSHAMDWNPNESLRLTGGSMLDPANFGLEYGTSNLDQRHTATALALFEPKWKLHGLAGRLANGWVLSGVGSFRSGLPYTIRTAGSLPKRFVAATGAAVAGLGPGMNGSGGDNRIYGTGSDGLTYNLGRNTYRYPANWKADLRLGKRFDLGRLRELELLAESLNLFNHRNVTEIETVGYTIESGTTSGGLPTLNFLTGLKANTTAFGEPLNLGTTNFYRERQIEFGLRLRF